MKAEMMEAEMMEKVGIIGFGNMGSAFALGLQAKGIAVAVADQKPDTARMASESHGFQVMDHVRELAENTDPVVIAVKPQDVEALSRSLGGSLSDRRVISIMAGRSMGYLKKILKPGQIARFMPNLAAREKKAIVGISFDPDAGDGFRRDCFSIAEAIGTPCEIPEKLMPAFTGLSSSGIAFVFAFFHAMALAGVKQGFPYPQSLEISLQTIGGALALVKENGGHPIEWLSRVISPAGTTIQGVAALEELGFSHSVMEAVEKASKRAQELES
jgi:pyrroline-5-carboxylate reductase